MNSNYPSGSVLPVAIIGAGPIGLAAAAHLHERGIKFVVLEAGSAVGSAMREWSHVRLFSPWSYNIDPAAERMLRSTGWVPPVPSVHPTGGEILAHYLTPLGNVPQLAPHLRFEARVTGITRLGRDKLKADAGRYEALFRIRFETAIGEEEILARAVIDATGTWRTPNPLGSEGIPARGEHGLRAAVRYGIPDVLNRERARYAGRRVLVAGSGHSAFNILLDLVKLTEAEPATTITWVVRRDRVNALFGGGERDKLAARGALGSAVRRLVESGQIRIEMSFQADAVEQGRNGIVVRAGDRVAGPVDEIIVATGFRPDFSFLSELQLGLDPTVESTPTLAPLIDPNLHSCGTVRPHGYAELSHPEKGFYIVGMKSYGRAPTFLMRTGYEQVRSIVAELAGDREAAERVELVLPETGVCSLQRTSDDEAACCGEQSQVDPSIEPKTAGGCHGDDKRSSDCARKAAEVAAAADAPAGCCGGAPVVNSEACCRRDEAAKAAGQDGCGCGDGEASSAAPESTSELATAERCGR
jgi:thioredoxin reductase